MEYLITQMLGSLAAAAALGFALGWLLRGGSRSRRDASAPEGRSSAPTGSAEPAKAREGKRAAR